MQPDNMDQAAIQTDRGRILDASTAGTVHTTRDNSVLLLSGTGTVVLPCPLVNGIRLTATLVASGTATLTIGAMNTAGNTTATLDAVGDTIELISADIAGTFRWRVLNNPGAGLSTP